MKKKFLPLLILLIFALAACGGELDTVVESAQNIAEDVTDSVNDELSGTDAESTPEPTEEPAEELVEEVVEEVVEEPAAGLSDRWAGSTLSTDMAAVGNAAVSINGVEGQSDGNGNFELYVPRAEDGRYVINAQLEGYLPISLIHIGAAMESLTLEFQPAEQFTVDPTQPIAVEDSGGTQINIGADQLVDENGNPPAGDVTLNMYTYDLENEEMVGDMSGTNSDGEDVYMESEGAFYAEFTDEDGTEYNLMDGAEAEISIPCEPRPDEVLTVWSYDANTGLWVEEGPVVAEGERCSANVIHFSYWNFDYEKRTPSCIKLDVEPGYLAANSPLNVQAVLQTNPTRVRDLSISQTTNVLINLPNNTDVQFFAAGESTPFATISSGAAWGSVGIPAFPYDACQGVAEVTDAPEPATGAVQGQVVNAINDQPIAGAQVCISGTDQCVTTDDSGNYSFPNVPVGDLALNVTASDFTPVDQSVTVTAGDPITQNFALSPVLPTGELRIVLTWGANPADLDSHLYLPDNTDIYYNNKGGFLDVDDTDSFGPETITIPQRADGTYSYAVLDFDQTGQLTTSEAVVRVYDDTGLIQTFPVPTTGTGIWWHVFDIDGATGAITPVNTLSNNPPR